MSSSGSSNSFLRIVAAGTIFMTHTVKVAQYPAEGTSTRAQRVSRERGGAAANTLGTLGQFRGVHCWLIAPIGGGPEGNALVRELEEARVSTRLCARRDGEGIPTAFIINADGGRSQTVVNYNPIPDITHDEFVQLISPLIYPQYANPNSRLSPVPPHMQDPSLIDPSIPPFDWIHFEGRTAQTTLNNMKGLDGLFREREWRHQIVISLEVGKPGRQGQEALIPYADVVFFTKAYAMSQSYTSPRPFLLSLYSRVPRHALLVVSWGTEGAAMLSVPTREYFQSSAFVPDPAVAGAGLEGAAVESVRSTSAMWSIGDDDYYDDGDHTWGSSSRHRSRPSESTEGGQTNIEDEILDEAGAEDAFVAGMIYALSRRILPGHPYTPSNRTDIPEPIKGRWSLEECIRFATELAGRKARKKGWSGLARAMEDVGWIDRA
jgi:ketohexokinase